MTEKINPDHTAVYILELYANTMCKVRFVCMYEWDLWIM